METKLPSIADFSDHERQLVTETLLERYARVVPVERVEVELQLDPPSEVLSTCPALYWTQRNAEFVVCKTGDSRFRTQFFYANGEQFGAGRSEYDSLGDCVIAVLQGQADDERRRAGMGSGSKAAATDGSDDYSGPLVI